jgi:hypothetical protein
MVANRLCLILLITSALSILHKPSDTGSSKSQTNDDQMTLELKECLKDCLEGCSPQSKHTELGLNCFQPCYNMCSSRHAVTDDGLEATANNLKGVPANYCTGGLDSKYDDMNKVLEAFAKGPCSPIMIAPGFMSSKLMVEIDCEVFQREYPSRFSECGWNACTKGSYEFWKSIPEKEYNLWIPTLTSPMSVFTYSLSKNFCFAFVFEMIIDINQPFNQMVKRRPGIKITTYGFTNSTRPRNKCGSEAISNLMQTPYQAGPLKAFNDIIKFLERAGYVSGLTLQAMPYNFFLSYRNNEFKYSFMPSLERMRKLTGKKVTIVAHSMGNLNTLHNLSLMTKEEKQNLIFNWISMAPPFLGAHFTVKALVAGMDGLQVFSGRLGLHLKAASYITKFNLSMYELLASDPEEVYKGQGWLKNVEKRLKYESDPGQIPYSDSGLTFWPPANDVCYEKSLLFHKLPYCLTRLTRQSDEVIIKIMEDEYRMRNFDELIKTYGLEKEQLDLAHKLRANDLYNVIPEVPVILIYTSAVPTPQRYEFDGNMRDSIDRDLYPQEILREDIAGDEKVPVFSMLYPTLKWALEHQSKPDPNVNYQPVKFLEFCSTGHTTDNIYDGKDENGTAKITESKYHGLTCSCNGHDLPNYSNCKHADMISDPFILQAIIHVAGANQVPDPASLAYIKTLTHGAIMKDIEECKHIKASIFD